MRMSRVVLGIAAVAIATAACSSSDIPVGATPVVSTLTPASVPVGATVTVTGSGFESTGNAVRIGGGYLLNLPSSNGTTITFTLPAALELCAPHLNVCSGGAMEMTPGSYPLAVTSPDGIESNAVTLTVIE